jgi:hypothetical protein
VRTAFQPRASCSHQLPVRGLGEVHQGQVLDEGEPLLTDYVGVDGAGQGVYDAGEGPDDGLFVPTEGLKPFWGRCRFRCDGGHAPSLVA